MLTVKPMQSEKQLCQASINRHVGGIFPGRGESGTQTESPERERIHQKADANGQSTLDNSRSKHNVARRSWKGHQRSLTCLMNLILTTRLRTTSKTTAASLSRSNPTIYCQGDETRADVEVQAVVDASGHRNPCA